MFTEEVKKFMDIMRFLLDFPFEETKELVAWDKSFHNQLSYEEFVALCVWIHRRTPGARTTLYGFSIREI